jgi:transcriptional regulator with XRE-family HTH domain
MLDLGQYLRTLREGRGYSLRDLERKSGYSNGFIAMIESGKRVPKRFALMCLLESMGIKDTSEADPLFLDARVKIAC